MLSSYMQFFIYDRLGQILDFGEVSPDRQVLSRVTRKVLSYSKHTLLCLYGHNVLARIKPNTIENTAVVRSSGWRRKASKDRLIFSPLKDELKVFLHIIRFICHTIKM